MTTAKKRVKGIKGKGAAQAALVTAHSQRLEAIERAAFEEWVTRIPSVDAPTDREKLRRRPDGEYHYLDIEQRWRGWYARGMMVGLPMMTPAAARKAEGLKELRLPGCITAGPFKI